MVSTCGIQAVFGRWEPAKATARNPLHLLEKKLEAGVRIELTIGVLQAKNGGFRLFPPLANLALNTLVDSHLRDFCKTVNIVKHRVTLSKVSITASITEVSMTDGLGSLCDELRCLGIRFYPYQEADTLSLLE